MILNSVAALGYIPGRIISLVPSQTELLHWLGLEQETVGITKFCVHPDSWYHTKTRVGGTKNVNKAIIEKLRPDLIIANREENSKEEVEALANDYPVWLTDVTDLDDALQMIDDISKLTGNEKKGLALTDEIKIRFDLLNAQLSTTNSKLPTCYLIWQKPFMTVGGDTFINDMLSRCGFENIFAGQTRYPQITVSQLQTTNCKLLLLPSEPFPFRQNHLDELQIQLPDVKIILVDGEMFSWYGSRLLSAAEYFKNLIVSRL